jgi:hypothetical protein
LQGVGASRFASTFIPAPVACVAAPLQTLEEAVKLNLALLACASAAIALTSCKKAAQTVPTPPPAPATVPTAPPAPAPAAAADAPLKPLSSPATTADGRSAKVLQQTEIGPLLSDAPKGAGGGTFVVDGVRSLDDGFLIADRIQFRSAAVLTFSPQAIQSRRNLLIVAREVVSDDPLHPGKITYALPPAGAAQAGGGQAKTAPQPPREGQAGPAGRAGETGAVGSTGFDAPNLTLIVASLPSGGPAIDVTGGPGGTGAQGRPGSDGGAGGWGRPAKPDTFKCTRPAGNGGPGGAGGAGGGGGQGGSGGGGGTVTVLGFGDRVPGILQKLHVTTAGGEPGQGGPAGKGGLGGLGGRGGQEARPFCTKAGRSGPAGLAGRPGEPGIAGQRGVDGDLFVGAISEADLNRIQGRK